MLGAQASLPATNAQSVRALQIMDRKKVGLALSGGAARGFAHVGVLKALVDNGIPIDMITGTSAGSVVGGAFAAGMTPDEIEHMGSNISWLRIGRPSFSPRGILSNTGLGDLIKKNFPANRFEDLKVPFAAVACDIQTSDEIVLKDEGDVVTAIRASCAIPGVFTPIDDPVTGKTLVDGGVVAPVPTRAVREMGAEIVIAVDVLACGSANWGNPTTLIGMIFQSGMMLLRTASLHQHYNADIVIIPEISHIRPDELGRVDELVKAGEEAALAKMDGIKALISQNL